MTIKQIITIGIAGMAMGAVAFDQVKVTAVEARQRYPWNGLVDIIVMMNGSAEEVDAVGCFFAATNSATGAAIPIMSITRKGSDMGSGTTWSRRFVWDAAKDVGTVKIDDVALSVDEKVLGGVQLWDNGPYWAECNVGATKPEEYGYYFWWGDTVGYKRNAANDGWISVRDGSIFSFTSGNCPTYAKSNSQLQSAGYIDSTGNLVAAHDAATAYLGTPWCMPTYADFDALVSNCDTIWTQRNGVWGRLVKGRGAFASKSIFIPAAGYGNDTNLFNSGSFGYCWSPKPNSVVFYRAIARLFDSRYFNLYDTYRYEGYSIRPLRGFSNGAMPSLQTGVGVTTHLKLDCRTGTHTAAETETITYSTEWVEGVGADAVAVLSVNGEVLSEQLGSGVVEWTPSRGGTNVLTHVVMNGGVPVGDILTATFNVNGGPYTEIIGGVEWTYMAQDGLATLGSGNPKGPTAVTKTTVGAIVVPSRIGGCGVKAIADYAFQGCDKLTAVTIHEGIVRIGTAAFSGCDGLDAVDFEGAPPDGVADAGIKQDAAIRYNVAYEALWLPVIQQCGWTNAKPYLYPAGGPYKDTVDGIEWTFMVDENLNAGVGTGMQGITAVTKSTIGSIVIPAMLGGRNVKSINGFAFYQCAGLTSVTIPSSVSLIQSVSFQYCTGLTRIMIPSSVTCIGYSVFAHCSGLGQIDVDLENPCYSSVDGVLFEKGGSVLMAYPGGKDVEYVIPSGVSRIETGAFDGCDALVRVTIPFGVLSIGDQAFLDCCSLEDVRIPFGVRSLGTGVFYGCDCLKSIEIPSSVEDIRGGAFGSCRSLLRIDVAPENANYQSEDGVLFDREKKLLIRFPGGRSGEYFVPPCVERLEYSAFQFCSGLTSVTISYGVKDVGESCFWGCTGLTSVTIPSSVTNVDQWAFVECSGLTDVIIPSSLTSIGDGMFSGCSGLTSVAIPSSVTSIGGGAFSNCGGLADVTIPLSVINIGAEAFCLCSGLTRVTIPASVMSLGSWSFAYCYNLNAVNFEGAPPEGVANAQIKTDAAIRYNVVYEDEWLPVIQQCGWTNAKPYTPTAPKPEGGPYTEIVDGVEWSFVVDEQLNAIVYGGWGEPAVPASTTGAITIPVKLGGRIVSQIGDYAFVFCEGLTDVTIPSTVTRIGEWSFLGCTGLTGLVIPPSVMNIEALAFNGCSGLQGVTICEGVLSIGNSAFSGCYGLTSVMIPATVTNISERAFAYCESLQAIEVNASSKYYSSDDGVLFNADRTTLVQFPGGRTGVYEIPFGVERIEGSAFENCSGITDVLISLSVTDIGRSAFQSCYGLTTITIPSSVASIEEWVFSSCTALISIEVASDNAYYSSQDGVLFDKTMAELIVCPAGRDGRYVVPDSVTNIQSSAFFECVGLQSVVIPSGVLSINDEVFYGCSSLVDVTIPSCVTNIGSVAFTRCSALTDITLPSNLVSIGAWAFSECSALKCVEIPASVTSIEHSAFSQCSSLTDITVEEGCATYTDNDGVLFNRDGSILICYPCGRIGGYSVPNGTEIVDGSAFIYCSRLTRITIPSSVTRITGNTFFRCDNLDAVDFEGTPPDGVDDADIKQDAAIRYNVAYEAQWLPVIQQCGWTNATPYMFPSVVDVMAQQRYPWNGKVDITYMVENAGAEYRQLSVWAADQTTGVTNIARSVIGDTAYTGGKHHIVWDMEADGLSFVSTNVIFGVSYGPPLLLYCAIDLSGGTSATSYPVTYLDAVPSGGWSDEYKTTKLILRKIGAGTFTMGSPTDELGRHDKEGQHQVTLTKDYYIGVFPVTQRQWELVMGTRPSYFNNDAYYAPRPVECVTYNEIRGSSAGAGWPNSSDVDADSFLGVLRAKSGLLLDLPTEAQWECACRAGTTTALNSGKNLTSTKQDAEMDKVGRYYYNGGSGGFSSQSCDWNAGTAKVGSYAPNAWGLYDMHGNVWEWCLDWYGSYSGDVTDPRGCSSGSDRVMRGGGLFNDALYCRSARRNYCDPSSEYSCSGGFRLVRSLSGNAVSELTMSSEAVAAPSGGAGVQGVSDPVWIDLTSGWRKAAKTETITYSTEWYNEVKAGGEGGDADAVAVVSVNGEVISEQTGCGTVLWSPVIGSLNELTHVVVKDGVQVGETLTASFSFCGPFKEVVGNIEWTYTAYNGKATVGSGSPNGPTAVPKSTTGSIVIPERLGGCVVTGIGAYAFKDCTGLTEVTLPTNVVTIGANAFANDYYLDNVVIPDSVEEIGDRAFLNCTQMASITFGKGLKDVGDSAFENCIELRVVVFQEGLKSLGASAFYAASGSRLQSVSLPASLESVGQGAFLGSALITGVTVPTHVDTLAVLFPKSYQKIESVVIPEGEGAIRVSMFAGCVGLKTIIIPSTVTNIGASAFANCSALVELGLPDEVTVLGARAFYGCSALKTVSLPRNLAVIADETFAACPMLDSLVIPASVTSLGHRIYSGATVESEFVARLTGIYYLGDAPEVVYSDSYAGTPSELKSYIVNGSKGWVGPGVPGKPLNGWPACGNARDVEYWTPNEFEVTFDGNGGTPETYVSKQITDTTYSLPKSDPVRGGYLFKGWWTEKEAGAQIYWNTRVTATKAHTLYAHWKSLVEMITVRFNPNGGTVEPSEKTYPPGVTFGELPVPTRIGHNFVGWYTSQVGGDLVTESTVVSKEHNELYAHWEPITYRVAFDANGGSGTMYDQTHTYNVAQALTANAYSLTGYNFTGWSETRGGVVKYANQQVVENLAEIQGQVVTLYAVWSGEKYSVRFDANGGEGIMANQTHQVGVPLALSKCTFTRENHTFLGWATTPQGEVVYEDEEEVQDLTLQASATVPLYAVWKSTGVEAPVFSPKDGTVFKGSCTVTLTCPTPGASIYYRIGAKPKATSKYLYSAPFEITETSTVYAFAKSGDTESDCVTATYTKGKVITFEEAVKAKGITAFTHGGDAVWGVEEGLGEGDVCVRSGVIIDEQVSWFETTVEGPGTISFKWKASCEEDYPSHEWDHLAFNIDGAKDDYARLDGVTDWEEVSAKLEAGTHTLRWSYVKDESDAEGEDCGWVDCVTWVADAPAPVPPGGEIVVPEGKTAKEFADEVNKNKAQYLNWPLEGPVSTDYLGYFTAVPKGDAKVEFVLSEEGTNEVEKATTTVKTAALGAVFSEGTTLKIDEPLVGFYYSLRQGGDLSVGAKADLNKLGGRDEISFELTKGPFQYFYQTLVTPTRLPEEK